MPFVETEHCLCFLKEKSNISRLREIERETGNLLASPNMFTHREQFWTKSLTRARSVYYAKARHSVAKVAIKRTIKRRTAGEKTRKPMLDAKAGTKRVENRQIGQAGWMNDTDKRRQCTVITN